MATKKLKETAESTHDEGLLKKTAVGIGSAIGAIAAHTGLGDHGEERKPRAIAGKIQKSGKHRLPRKMKKQRAKPVAGSRTA